jgi:hypothetical protein
MSEATPPPEDKDEGQPRDAAYWAKRGREAGGLRSAGGGRQPERAGKTRCWGAAGLRPALVEDLPGAASRDRDDARRGRAGLERTLPRVPAGLRMTFRRHHREGLLVGVDHPDTCVHRQSTHGGADEQHLPGCDPSHRRVEPTVGRLEHLQRLPRRRRDNSGPDPVACARRRPNLRDSFPHRRLHDSGEDLDARPQVACRILWGERAGNPGEGLCGYEASVVASEERLAKRWGPIHALHDGRTGASYAQPATRLDFPMTGEDHMAFWDRQPRS